MKNFELTSWLTTSVSASVSRGHEVWSRSQRLTDQELLLFALILCFLPPSLGVVRALTDLERSLDERPLELDPPLAELHLEMRAGHELLGREGFRQVVWKDDANISKRAPDAVQRVRGD